MTNTPSPSCCPRYVFVYGTLRAGESNDINRLLPAPRYIGPAHTDGALYDLGSYPGARLRVGGGAGAALRGDVYAIEPALEQVLDTIEGIYPVDTHEYAKRDITVRCCGEELGCLVYEIAPNRVRGMPPIASGDWCAYRRLRDAGIRRQF